MTATEAPLDHSGGISNKNRRTIRQLPMDHCGISSTKKVDGFLARAVDQTCRFGQHFEATQCTAP
ncbi:MULTISPECIES: hypothetical protein [unclassified Synechococcus]|uniref:hypothetical protein n=1 Tax=Synechococcales TaxID=1890424 RepID=UPI0016299726|nr:MULTISPECIES: hypothetical protein [unclassified Synechococcus]